MSNLFLLAMTLSMATISPERLYYQPQSVISISIDSVALEQALTADLTAEQKADAQAATGRAALPRRVLLLSPKGEILAAARLKPGATSFDLAKVFDAALADDSASPETEGPYKPAKVGNTVWNSKTTYVQLLVGDKPVGPALVVVPLSPPNAPATGSPNALRIYIEKHAHLQTDAGDIIFSFDPAVAPTTSHHIASLIAGGFYTNVIFHRTIPGFVIQGGDPTGTGGGGPGFFVDLERSAKQHTTGTVSMARQGHDENTNGSQFFICLSREGCAALDNQYTAFGDVVKGMEVVQAIATAKVIDTRNSRPVKPVVIKTATLIDAPPRKVTTR